MLGSMKLYLPMIELELLVCGYHTVHDHIGPALGWTLLTMPYFVTQQVVWCDLITYLNALLLSNYSSSWLILLPKPAVEDRLVEHMTRFEKRGDTTTWSERGPGLMYCSGSHKLEPLKPRLDYGQKKKKKTHEMHFSDSNLCSPLTPIVKVKISTLSGTWR